MIIKRFGMAVLAERGILHRSKPACKVVDIALKGCSYWLAPDVAFDFPITVASGTFSRMLSFVDNRGDHIFIGLLPFSGR